MYTYHQSYGQITLLVELPPGTRSTDVHVDLTPYTIEARVSGLPALIQGRLVAAIVPEVSEWFLEGRQRHGRRTSNSGSSSGESTGRSTRPVTEFLDREDLKRTLSPFSSTSASSYDLLSTSSQPSSHLNHRPASPQGSSDEGWLAARRQSTSDEGELIDHPLGSSTGSLSAFSELSSDDFSRSSSTLRVPEIRSRPPPVPVEPLSPMMFPHSTESSESSHSPASTSSTRSGSGRPMLSPSERAGLQVDGGGGGGGGALDQQRSRLLTIHLIKAEGAIWDGLVIVGELKDDGLPSAKKAVWEMDGTSLVALAVELSAKPEQRETAFEMLLHAHQTDQNSLATYHLFQTFFPPQTATSRTGQQQMNATHLLRLGGTSSLAALYIDQAVLYSTNLNPPPPLPHQRYPLDRSRRDDEPRERTVRLLIRQARNSDRKVRLPDALREIGDEDEEGLGSGCSSASGSSGSERPGRKAGRPRKRSERQPPPGRAVGVWVFGGATFVLVVAVGISWWKKPKAD